MTLSSALRRFALVAVLFGSTNAFAGYDWWWYTTNAFLSPSVVPAARSKSITVGSTTYTSTYQDAPNFAFRPVTNVAHQHELVVFLPGAGATTDQYQGFYQEAVNQGYYVVALDYLNGVTTHAMCACNSSCYGALAQQLTDGVDHNFYDTFFATGGSPGPGNGPGNMVYNSIANRLQYFLQFMQYTADPNGSWTQFLDPANNNKPRWSSIIIAGHSDGGMYASWILKNHGAEKGLTFSAPSTRLWIDPSALASTELTHANTQCTPTHAPPQIWAQTNGSCDFPSTKLRTLLAFGDPAYDSSNGADEDGRDQSANLNGPCMKTGPNRVETRVDTTATSCSWIQANATEWLTLMNAGAGHFSTVGDGASIPSRTCIWDLMLND